jgi:branched-chain amino acid transport system permease protein
VKASTIRTSFERAVGLCVVVVLALGPLVFSHYWLNSILTYTFWVGIAAAGLIFLSAYGGMVSLAQVPIYGIAGFVLGNAVTTGGTSGLNLGWSPWIGVALGVSIATGIGLLFGALASRSAGIYFLMITLTYGVVTNLFFNNADQLSGFNGITSIQQHMPGLLGNASANQNDFYDRLYYVAFCLALIVYVVIRYVVRTPFGLALQGIRDDPVRMSSLGYNVPLHKTLAFGVAGLLAAVAGIIQVWWIGEIAPSSIDLNAVLGLLIAAVIGGLHRLEGAWLGAFAYVLINNYTHSTTVPLIGGTFNTVIGLIFLGIVLVSPGGLLGMWDWLTGWLARELGSTSAEGAPVARGVGSGGGQ